MPDMRYFHAEEEFLTYSWQVYQSYYSSKDTFLSQYQNIATDEQKNLFLMLVSFYKFLVRDGEYRLKEDDEFSYVDYLDETYKFISLMSLIEAMFSDEKFVDFYQWLTMKERRTQVFPISNPTELENYYREYKDKFGAAKKAIKFFQELDDSAKNFLAARMKIDEAYKPTEIVAQKLYSIRSEFVHEARLILEFNEGRMFSIRNGKEVDSILSLNHLQLIIEHGILYHFGLVPDNKKI
jgi:hypothetical protein